MNGKRRRLTNRGRCLTCLPFGSSIYSRKTTPAEKAKARARNTREWYERRKKKDGVDPILARRKARKAEAVAKFGGACQVCGYSRCMRNLAFHHLGEKAFPLSERAFQFSWKKLLPELAKCALLCHNCHGEVHEGLVDLRPRADSNGRPRA